MENIRLTYGRTTAQVQLKGAQMASFRGADGREVIWQADPNVWAQHAPVLFPICGSVRDDQVLIEGQPYPMTKHGFSRAPIYEVYRRGADYVDLLLTANEDTRRMYPFDFAFHVIYSLFENGYTTTFLIENRSDRVMPCCVGGHPGFACPMEDGAVFEDYQVIFEQPEDGRNYLAPTGALIDGYELLPLKEGRVLPLAHELFDTHDALIFAGLKSRSVDLVHRTSGKGLRFAFPKMEVLAIWTKPHANADYVCLEPWHGMPGQVTESGRFEDKPYVTLLAPGECCTTWFTTTLIG